MSTPQKLINEQDFNKLDAKNKVKCISFALVDIWGGLGDFDDYNIINFTTEKGLIETYHQLCAVKKFLDKINMVGINVNIRPVVINRNEKEQYKMVFILESIGDNIVIPKQLSFIEIDPYELQICLDKNKNIVLNLYNIENFTTDNQFLGINKLYDEVICTLEGALLRNQLILNEETYKTFEAVMYNIQQKRYKKT